MQYIVKALFFQYIEEKINYDFKAVNKNLKYLKKELTWFFGMLGYQK